jgi:DNA processing protein
VDQQRAAYVALALTPGIGPSRIHAILEVCHTAIGAFSAPFEFLRSIPGINVAAASAISASGVSVGVRVLEEVERLGARALISDDPEYPALLREIPEPPPVLFALGDLRLLERPAVAIVGSRDHSDYGGEVAHALAWGAASGGLAVVSGMARGLDAVAHNAALEAGGATIGVLGNGLGVIYPAANRALYQRVAERGLLLTEFPPGEKPSAGSFPRRNRLISGLARVTVVVEAAEGSGALITAGTALDQGRDVMVVPGNITSPSSVGANRLIRDGAEPLLSSDDLLAHYPEAVRPSEGFAAPPTRPLPEALSAVDRAVAELLGTEPVVLDDLVGRSGRPPQELLAVLCALEIAGVVEQSPGRMFRRV